MPLKILLADDSMTAQKMGQKILVDAGHVVIAVSNGAAAVKKIASERPDMAVLDIYMPGYTGLEVCERVRAAQETAKVPVLLTVGKMEMGSFKPEDAKRVKADGVIIKPFEATDLLAAIKKIEEKLAAAPAEAAPADYERTQKINVAEMLKQDSSYQEWQVSADEHKDEEAAEAAAVDAAEKKKIVVPQDMAGETAFGDMLGDEPVETQAAALEAAPMPATPAAFATAPSVAVEPVAPPLVMEAVANTQVYAAPSSSSTPHRDPELEPTSAKHHVDMEHAADPHFEPTVSQEHIDVAHTGQDPALVTDASEMASAFVTKFGVDNPEPIVVGVAADANISGLYTESAPVEEASDETPTQEVSASIARMRELEKEAESVEMVEEGEPAAEAAPAPAHVSSTGEDDFEKRVAAAMNTYEAPAEAAPEPGPQEAVAAVAAAESAPAASAWVATEASVEHHEANVSLDHEMLKAFSAAVPADPDPAPAPEAAPEPEVAVAPPAPPAPPAPANAPDLELATAIAAAVAPDAGPPTIAIAAAAAAAASGGTIDPARLAEAIHRAIDRLKPELIAHIAKELERK
ncbi:MAG: response regulator [Candidatus Koribacter versatilis]|uniref:Response regulator n=1 Tax=Candidatus Korobacter versatilis TaxID=658062 RepID=A0A932ENZ5_9BACT|nr:response regulator [Candidatus Koribacter versatilis]